MKKLKKSSNKRPNIVFIYGPIAVGKLTVAKVLSRKLGYKLAHNHALNDFVQEIFDRNTLGNHEMKDFLRYYVMESAAKHGLNMVATHAYDHNFISKTGLSDPKFVETMEKKIKKAGANFYPIHLVASNEILMKRLTMPSRKEFYKLTNTKIMRKILPRKDYKTSPKVKNNLIIDNTKLSPQKVADAIIKHFKLK